MNNWFKNILVIVIITIIAIAFPQSIQAQQLTGAFIMSSVGGLNNMSNNSMAVIFSSSATCLNMQNATAVLAGDRGTGNFAINCEMNAVFNSLGIKLYPNPVNTTTKVKFINTPPLTETFNLSVWTTEGALLSTRKESGYNLFQGINLDVSALGSGTYVLKIESENYVDALKFIKAN